MRIPKRLTPLLERLVIQPKARGLQPFRLNSSQRPVVAAVEADFAAAKPSRIIVLKARQLGISTLGEALLLCLAMSIEDTVGAVVAHDTPTSQHLYRMLRLFYAELDPPIRKLFPTKSATRRQLIFNSNRSGVEVYTAANVHAMRGRTLHAVHASEVAMWREPEDTMAALQYAVPRLPGTLVLVESTAWGAGNWFHDEWLRAIDGESEYTPVFLPWWKHDEYVADPKDGRKPYDEEERELIGRFKLGPDRIAWRRRTIRTESGGDLDKFHQEHPSTWEEAFQATGRPVFVPSLLQASYDERPVHVGRLAPDARRPGRIAFVAQQPDAEGPFPLRAYLAPGAGKTYFIGASPQHPALDIPSAAVVINRDTSEQVALWEGHIDPLTFAGELAHLGAWYNQALVAPDVEDVGYGLIDELRMIYPHIFHHRMPDRVPGKQDRSRFTLGWSNNWKRQAWAMSVLMHQITSGRLILHDEALFDDLASLSVRTTGKIYDYEFSFDGAKMPPRVLALAIACVGLRELRARPAVITSNVPSSPFIVDDGGRVRMIPPPSD